jgi:hypothetical protein
MALIRLNNQSLSAVTSAGIPIRSGSVLQVIQTENSTQVDTTSSTYVSTGLTATITPSATSSKILVCAQVNGVYKDGSNQEGVGIRLKRGSSEIKVLAIRAAGDSSDIQSVGTVGADILDSPNTTSATTYSIDMKATGNAANAYVQVYGVTSSITLMEIAG